MTTMSEHAVYEFGPFRLDVSEALLMRDDSPVPLRAKTFHLLLILVQNAGHMLLKEELITSLWPNTFVEEHNLAVHISELRKILGRDNEYITTVVRRGYRFAAKVTKLGANYSARDSKGFNGDGGMAHPNNAITLAILPLKQIAGEAGIDEYLGVGLADSLITRLSALRHIIVRPTSAVRRYIDDTDPIEAGKTLMVGLVLDGSFQRTGERIRVTLQLFSVSDGNILWAGKYDENNTDILSVEDSVSEQVAASLALKLTFAESNFLIKHPTDNIDAYTAYMQGKFFWSKHTPSEINKCIEYFSEAIRLDSNFAAAYVGLARAKISLFAFCLLQLKDEFPEIERLVDRALKIDNCLPEAHSIKAQLRLYIDLDWEGAEKEHTIAISVGHNCAYAYENYSIHLSFLGRFEEALALNQIAQVLEPTSLLFSTSRSRILFFAREYERSISELKSILELDNDRGIGYFLLGVNYDMLRQYEEAQWAYNRYLQLYGDSPEILSALCLSHALAGDTVMAQQILDKIFTIYRQKYVSPCYIAYAYLGLGEVEKSLSWLEKAYVEQDSEILLLKVDPRFDKLRKEPRFIKLLERVMRGR